MDDLLGRRVPQNIEAEQAVIGSMILDSRCVPDVIELLRADDFNLRDNREIFETIHHMFGLSQPVDPVTLIDRMQARGVYSDATARYIKQLMEVTPTVSNVRYYAEIVRDKSLLRQVANAATEINGLVYDGEGEANAILDAAEQKIYDIRQGRTIQEFKNVGEVMVDVFERLSELAKNKGRLPGLTTGFGELDMITTGLNKSDLVIIAARPGVGKTSLALNIMLNAVKRNTGTAVFFSLEMSREQLVTRLLSSESFVDSNKLLTGNLDTADWALISPAAENLSKMSILIDDNPAIAPAEMKAKCRRVKGLSLIIIDYLQLMSSGAKRNDNRAQEVSEISRAMKIMAKELNVPVVCLSQLSRESEKGGSDGPKLSHLRESGAIEQDADIIMFLYRDGNEGDNAASSTVTCNVAKNRHGRTGQIELLWHAQTTTFASYENDRNAPPY